MFEVVLLANQEGLDILNTWLEFAELTQEDILTVAKITERDWSESDIELVRARLDS